MTVPASHGAQRLLLIDGHGMVYRAFHAMPPMETGAGVPTGAVFGAVRMLRCLREQWRASHWLVVFDGGRPRERTELVEDYKAQRAPMPDPLRTQMPLIESYLEYANIPSLRVEGQEADDVMASIAECARRDGMSVRIATSDKDLYQVVSPEVHVVPMSGAGEALDPEGVREKLGVTPEQVVGWLALVGDSVDNIPGVPGIGRKTAAALLQQFGSLEEMLKRGDEIEREKLRKALDANRDVIERNVAMVRLRRDLDTGPELDELRVVPPDGGRLLGLFRELEMKQFAHELEQPDLF